MSDKVTNRDRLSDHELAPSRVPRDTRSSSMAATSSGRHYICPTHPDIQSEHAGICPKCGMSSQRLSGR